MGWRWGMRVVGVVFDRRGVGGPVRKQRSPRRRAPSACGVVCRRVCPKFGHAVVWCCGVRVTCVGALGEVAWCGCCLCLWLA